MILRKRIYNRTSKIGLPQWLAEILNAATEVKTTDISSLGLYGHLMKEGPSWKTFWKPSGSHTVSLCFCINNYGWPARCFSNQVTIDNCVYETMCAPVYYGKGCVNILYYTNHYLLLITTASIIKDVLKNPVCNHCLPWLDLLNKKKGIYSRKRVSCASWRKKEYNIGLEILSVRLWLVPVRMRGKDGTEQEVIK